MVCCAKGEAGGEGDDQKLTREQQLAMRSRSVDLKFPPWPNAVVPYKMSSGFAGSSIHTSALASAIGKIQSETCVRFVARTDEDDYLLFMNTGPNGGCSSYLGVAPSSYQPQEVDIADWCAGSRWYSTVHEIVHALGFIHEQCRLDRDDYVDVNMSNPKANNTNYKIMPSSDAKVVSAYDYDSVMHYPKEVGLLEPKDSSVTIGQRSHLSDCDIAKINRHYECHSSYQQSACPVGGEPPGGGGYDDYEY
jgi:hypothetical protein